MSFINNMRYAINDPVHINQSLWDNNTVLFIQKCISDKLKQHNSKYTSISIEQIKNVMDSISQSNPHKGTTDMIEMVISYIVSYIINEEQMNKKPEYNKDVIKYDGSYGIQRMSEGQLNCIKKKGLNPMGRMF
jgi:hypothetical protein